MKFVQGFQKTAAHPTPSYFHKMHLSMDARKYTPGYSKKRLFDMLKRRMKPGG